MTAHSRPMADHRRKRPKDPNQLAKFIVDAATSARESTPIESQEREKNPAAVSLGRRGGLKGGKARAASLTADQKREIARRAAEVRWANKSRDDD